jgi:hypothetical protein
MVDNRGGSVKQKNPSEIPKMDLLAPPGQDRLELGGPGGMTATMPCRACLAGVPITGPKFTERECGLQAHQLVGHVLVLCIGK